MASETRRALAPNPECAFCKALGVLCVNCGADMVAGRIDNELDAGRALADAVAAYSKAREAPARRATKRAMLKALRAVRAAQAEHTKGRVK